MNELKLQLLYYLRKFNELQNCGTSKLEKENQDFEILYEKLNSVQIAKKIFFHQ